MVDSCRVFTYSLNNKYAQDYYNACKHFDDVRNKVIAFEHSNCSRTDIDYKKLMEEFEYWDKKVPELSVIAGKEEDRLAEEKRLAQSGTQTRTVDYYA